MARSATLRRRQLDRVLARFQSLARDSAPPGGWLGDVRRALGMRTDQVAKRLGVYPSAVTQFEQAEAEGVITLNSLRKVAAALGCRVVYGIVPESGGSLEEMVRNRADMVARRIGEEVSHSMVLEDQATALEEHEAGIADMSDELVRRLPRALWDDPGE